MTTKTQWEPDTCGCRLRLLDDGATFERRCARHGEPVTAAQVAAENRRKNAVMAGLAETYSEDAISWQIDGAGVLTFAVEGVDQVEVDPAVAAILEAANG
jgi:hypothetical protein